MRLGLLVRRLNQLPYVESTARAAHARGHEVILLLDQRGSRTGPKGAQWPDVDKIPPRWQEWWVYPTTWPLHRDDETLDALVVPGPIGYPPAEFDRLPSGMIRVALQTSWSDLMWLRGEWSAVYCWSDWWRLAADRYARATGQERVRRLGVPGLELAPLVSVGFPLADHLAWLDPIEIRTRFGLPQDPRRHRRPIYVLAPFPFGAHDGLGWRLRWIYRWAPWGDREVVDMLRAWVTELDGILVVKHRPKSILPSWTRKAADLVIEDAEAGEPTMLHLLSVASGGIGFYSTSVLEAVAADCPWLCLAPKVWPAYGTRIGQPWWEPIHDAPPFVQQAPLRLGGFRWKGRLDPDTRPGRRNAYVQKFLGGEPFRAGERVVEDLEARVSATMADRRWNPQPSTGGHP